MRAIQDLASSHPGTSARCLRQKSQLAENLRPQPVPLTPLLGSHLLPELQHPQLPAGLVHLRGSHLLPEPWLVHLRESHLLPEPRHPPCPPGLVRRCKENRNYVVPVAKQRAVYVSCVSTSFFCGFHKTFRVCAYGEPVGRYWQTGPMGQALASVVSAAMAVL